MVIINFVNKWEIIIIIRDKKYRDKFFVRWKKFPDFFFPDKVFRKVWIVRSKSQ